MSQPPITPEQMAALPPEFRALLQAVIDHDESRIAVMEDKIKQLEARLNQTPRNSSKLPSGEHPHVKSKPSRKRSDRKPGGQPGHDKHARTLIPTEQCTAVVSLKPENSLLQQKCKTISFFGVFAKRGKLMR